MGVQGTGTMSQEEYRKAAVDAVRKLASDVGIPKDLKGIAKEEDVRFLSESAVADACAPGNPKEATPEDIETVSYTHLDADGAFYRKRSGNRGRRPVR